MKKNYYIGLDIGSTSIKAVVTDSEFNILWKKYERHETRQFEKMIEFISEIEKKFEYPNNDLHLFLTGSGSNDIAEILSFELVQEVNAITSSVEKFYPEVNTVIELGGQDAKMLLFIKNELSVNSKKITSMNDKCAGGTGVVIDKIASKLNIRTEDLRNIRYYGTQIHNVAGKCGVFAETDINSLQKQGIPKNELMASLFESIVDQNLSVLTRGFTLRDKVLLLGGPNTFIKGLVEAWQNNILKLWKDRNYDLPDFDHIEELIFVPDNSEYFAALGAILNSIELEYSESNYRSSEELKNIFDYEFSGVKKSYYNSRLMHQNLDQFLKKYSRPQFNDQEFTFGKSIEAFVGIDGGSTSSKAVLIDRSGEILIKHYQISKGNPIDDVKEIFENIQSKVEKYGAKLEILGVGVTGYAKDIIKDTINADLALVETVAHSIATQYYYPNVDVICDVGGQDIKIIILKNNRIVDFKLNTQCSAGNGYFLQNTAESFGFSMNEFADIAFSAKSFPEFNYGCAVFLQSDIVNFQRKGWKANEILAGLANVLPKNIWSYVAQYPNITSLGNTFVLQGGTQYNLAAAKSQIDYIELKFKEKNKIPNIIIHEHAGECGAIGAALQVKNIINPDRQTSFIGLEKVKSISYKTYRNEKTKCNFCKNSCYRTFIDIHTTNSVEHDLLDTFEYKNGPELTKTGRVESTEITESKNIPDRLNLLLGETRLIIASCEKGTAEDINEMRSIQERINKVKNENPNLLEYSNKILWASPNILSLNKNVLSDNVNSIRKNTVIGIPRVLNFYQYSPFFITYFESLGIPFNNIVFSDFTSESLFKEGNKRGSIDPCYPSKVTLSHIHNLIFKYHIKKKINIIFFPMIETFPSELNNTVNHFSCPAGLATPESVKAAFNKETDIFNDLGIIYSNPFLNLDDKDLVEYQLFSNLKDILRLEKKENKKAIALGYKALEYYKENIQSKGRELLKKIVDENRIGIVFLSRPYHNDKGLNHSIPEEFQKRGYPIFSIDSLPTDLDILLKLFKDDIESGYIKNPMEISDVWKNSFNENTNKKLWAAKFVARHPNLIAIELSNFKCGHDAPIYSVLREIIESTETPFFYFRDLDENKPTGSIKIRVETIDFFLKQYIKTKFKENKKSLKNIPLNINISQTKIPINLQ